MKTASDFRKQILWAVILPPIPFLVLSAIYFYLDVHLLSELDRVGLSDRVISGANAASRLLVDREAALRGGPGSGTVDRLAGGPQADAQLGGCFDTLARLVANDPLQSRRLSQIREQSDLRGRHAEATIGLQAESSRRDRDIEDDADPKGGPGGARVALTEFLEAEEADRDRRSDATQSRSWSVLTTCSGVTIALWVILAYSSRRRLVTLGATFEAALLDLEAKSDRQERETLRLLSEAMRYYAIFMLDPEGRITSWSEDAERILGYRTDDVMARRPSFFYSEEDLKRDVMHRDLEWAAQEGRVEDVRWIIRKDGYRFKASISLVAIRDSNEDLCGYTNVIHEIEDDQTQDDLRHRAG